MWTSQIGRNLTDAAGTFRPELVVAIWSADSQARLQKLLPKDQHALLYVHHFESPGAKVLKQVCAMDLEGIVAKRKSAPYGGTGWLKILNPNYSQRRGRAELFKKKA
jgi:hypothetical protein